MRCIDLNIDTLKILGSNFSYNKKLEEVKDFYKTVTHMHRVLKIWKMRKVTLEGKIVIFKTIVISKIVFQAFITKHNNITAFITTLSQNILSMNLKKYKSFFFGIIFVLR